MSPLEVALAPWGPRGGSWTHFALPEGPQGAHLWCFGLQFLCQVVQTLHELVHQFLDGLLML